MPSPDVLVVGAGVIGAAVAYHAAHRGLSVVLVERAPDAGLGSTARATGGFRAHFETAINVRLSLLARAQLRRFRHEHGVEPDFRPVGYLFLAQSAPVWRALCDAVLVQRAAGLDDTRLLAPDDIVPLAPHARLDDVIGATFAPGDGYIDPRAVHRGFLGSARRLGATLHLDAPVTRVLRDGADGRIVRVTAGDRDYTPGTIVNAAGAWAGPLAAVAGLDVPVRPERRCVVPTVRGRVLDPGLPMTVWTDDGFHVRVRDDEALVGWPHPPVPGVDDAFEPAPVEAAWIAHVERLVRERVPALRGVPLDGARAWSGLYEISPDHHALFGPHPGCDNLLLVNGSSGHGVMHAAALGLLAAEWLTLGATPSLDVTPLRPSRFAEGAAIVSPALL